MLTAQTGELLHRLKAGKYDPADVEVLGQISAQEFLAELNSVYRFRFQERRLRNKWEVGAARSLRFELTAGFSKSPAFPIFLMVPVFRGCLFLSGEGDSVTGVSTSTRLTARPLWMPIQGLQLVTGRGFKLDRTPDGWHLKPMPKKAVRLSEEFLRKRGWRFDTPGAMLSGTSADVPTNP